MSSLAVCQESQTGAKLVLLHRVLVHYLSACHGTSWQASLHAEPAVPIVDVVCL